MRIDVGDNSVRSHILGPETNAQQFPVVQPPDDGQNAGSPRYSKLPG